MPRKYRYLEDYEKELIEYIYSKDIHYEKRRKIWFYISEYINFYNNYRIQTKTKLTPLEKRNQFVA